MALSTAQENADLTHGLDESLVCAAGVVLAAASLENGNPKRAADVVVAASGGDELPFIPGVWRPRALELLTRCWLALDRRSEAEHAAARAQRAAASLRLRMADAMADPAAAAVALNDGDPDAAVEHALASAAAAADVGAPVEAALSRTLAGRALSPKPASQNEHSPSCNAPPTSFTPAGRSDTPCVSAETFGDARR